MTTSKYLTQKNIEDLTKWTLVLNDIRFNPFDLRLEIDQFFLIDPEQKKELGFSQLIVDVDTKATLSSLFSSPFTPTVKEITLVSPYVSAKLNNDGELNLADRLHQADTDPNPSAEEPDNAEASSQIYWALHDFSILNGTIDFEDHQPQQAFAEQLTDININLTGLTDDLSIQRPYSLAFDINNSSTQLNGMLALSPFKVTGDLAITEFALSTLQAYISEATHIKIADGKTSIKSQYDLVMEENLLGNIKTSMNLENLSILDGRDDAQVFNLENFSLGQTDFSLRDNTASIGPISLTTPRIAIKRLTDGSLSLAQLAKGSNQDSTNESSDTDASLNSSEQLDTEHVNGEDIQKYDVQESTNQTAFAFTLAGLEINEGEISVKDESITPSFDNHIKNLSLTIDQYDGKNTSAVEVAMSLLTDGALKISGQLSPDINSASNIAIDLKNLAISDLSPYTRHFTGYPVNDGRINLDLDYSINDSQLDSQHKIFVDHLSFDDKTDNDPVVSAPLPMLVGLLEDRNQLISLNVPVSGDLSSPSVNVRSLVVDGFQAFFTRLITSPFSMLGSLVGLDGDVSWVEFEAGSAELSPEQSYRLQQIARLLNERPKLGVTVKASYNPVSDLEALKAALANTGQSSEIKDLNVELNRLANLRATHIQTFLIEKSKVAESRIGIDDDTNIHSKDARPRAQFEIKLL